MSGLIPVITDFESTGMAVFGFFGTPGTRVTTFLCLKDRNTHTRETSMRARTRKILDL